MSKLFDMPDDEWVFLRNTQIELISEERKAKVGDRAALQNKIDDIETVLKGNCELPHLRKAYLAAGLSDKRAAKKIESLVNKAYKEWTLADLRKEECEKRLSVINNDPSKYLTPDEPDELRAKIAELEVILGETPPVKDDPCIKLSEAENRKRALIEALHNEMRRMYDKGEKPVRTRAILNLKNSRDLRKLGYIDGDILNRARKDSDPKVVESVGFTRDYLSNINSRS